MLTALKSDSLIAVNVEFMTVSVIPLLKKSLGPFSATVDLAVLMFDSTHTPSLSVLSRCEVQMKPNCRCQQTQGSSVLFTRLF